MFRYRAFGLTLASEMAIPELPIAHGTPDVDIRRSAPAPEPVGPVETDGTFEARPGHFDVRVPGLARFVVSGGRTIIIEPRPGAGEDAIRMFLLGTVVGALLHQRGVLPLHGSAVWKDGRTLVILGRSGIGKSSLAAALGRHGWRFQSDDISALRVVDGRVVCEPGFPRQKMWPDTLTMLGETPEQHVRVRPDLDKRSRAVPASDFHDASAPVAAVVDLRRQRYHVPRLVAVDGPARMVALKRQTFRARLPTRLQMHFSHFGVIGALAAQAPLWRLQRPRTDGSPSGLAEFLAPRLAEALDMSEGRMEA